MLAKWTIHPRLMAAARLGLTSGNARRGATTLVKGLKVGKLSVDQKIPDVFVWGVESVRNDISKLNSLPIRTPLGTPLPLSDAAEVVLIPAPNEIKREGAP
jgi:Cu/Ag efflux pump CusA